MTPEYTSAEKGRVQPPPPRQNPEGLPRAGTWSVPHVATAAARINTSARAYSQRYDEALQYNRANADRMLLDPVISTCLRIRANTTALLTFTIKPEDPENQLEVDAAAKVEKYIKRIDRFTEGARWLLYNGIWCGRSALQVRYGWTEEEKPYWAPNSFRVVHGDKLGFKWDGRVGIAIQSGTSLENHCQIEYLDMYPCYFLNEYEREGMIVHRCFSEDSDYFRPLQAGAIEGVGLRHFLYWIWVLKNEIWRMSLDFLQWFAKGLMVYYFESGNDEHLQQVKEWVETQNGDSAMLFPVFRDRANNPFPRPVERFDVSTANPQFLQALITNYFDDLIKFTILHQSATTGAVNTGLGSGVAEAHENTFDVTCAKMDATALADTWTCDLVRVMYRENHPGIPPGRWVYSIDQPNSQAMIDGAKTIVELGGSVPMEPIMEASGIPLITKGDTVLGGPQPSQPAAVGALPDNMPALGDASGQQPV